MSECWIGLGSNLGDAVVTFNKACSLLLERTGIEVRQRSGLYRTAAVGSDAGQPFLNAVCKFSTSLPPLELLDTLQSIESHLGRTRDVRWGPRTLDLDLLMIDDLILCGPRLTVPHPAMWYRRFVIDPLSEIAPNLRHPQLQLTTVELHQRLKSRPLTMGLDENWSSVVGELRSSVINRHSKDVALATYPSNELPPDCIGLRLGEHEVFTSSGGRLLVADLGCSPGDASRRVLDFMTAALDEPERLGDWPAR